MTRFVTFAVLVSLLALTGCKKPPDDKALAQGEWEIAAVDVPDETDKNEQREAEKLKDVTILVQGDRVTVTHAKEKGGLKATFTLDQTKSPREVDITEATVTGDDAGEPEAIPGTTRGIYQISGDELVLALPLGNGKNLPRPTEFKPLADKANHRGVLVFHLKKRK